MQPPEASSSINHDIDASSVSFPRNIGGSYENSFGDSSDIMTRYPNRGGDRFLPVNENTIECSSQFDGLDDQCILQAVIFLEDAHKYRSIKHKVKGPDLQIYRFYMSMPVTIFRYVVIFLLHILAFVEYPSSLTLNSDLRISQDRISLPCWSTQCLEAICLGLLLVDNILKMQLIGFYYFLRNKWDMGSVVIIILSLTDWTVSFALECQEVIRFRRILRPYFIFQNSSLMKKIVGCLRKTLPEVMSVLLLLGLHLFLFTLFGMLLFSDEHPAPNPSNSSNAFPRNGSQPISPPTEGVKYFSSLLDTFINLLVLLTTANNPDVTMPAYSRNRFASLFFVLYLLIGLYCFMNMLLAVIYNQFRGYFLSSMQSSLFRRRLGVRAAFEVLKNKKYHANKLDSSPQAMMEVGVGDQVIGAIIRKSLLPKHVSSVLQENLLMKKNKIFSGTEFQHLFYCLDNNIVHKQRPAVRWFESPRWRMIQRVFIHRYFSYFGMLMASINIIVITVQLASLYDQGYYESHSFLRTVNFSFIIYYCLEQMLKLWAFGWHRYISEMSNIFDSVITLALLVGEIYTAAAYGLPYFPHNNRAMWSILRMVNILIMVRMFKVIPYIKSMSLVITVLVDLMKNMKSFAGVLIVIFYSFAIVGMQLFQGAITYDIEDYNRTFVCGTYEQLNYWANNFDDFFASIIVLWDVMVVNNWSVFLLVFREETSPWSYLFFIVWWLLSVVIILNLFTALIMENFIMKWDRRHQIAQSASSVISSYEGLLVSVHLNNVYSMFRDLLEEPTDSELMTELTTHRYLRLI